MSVITDVKQSAFINSEALSNWKVKVFGVGSIGSNLIKQLALTGFKDITAYDFDTVDEDNLGSQEFNKNHIGMPKTEAIKKLMDEAYDFEVKTVDGKLTEESEIIPEDRTIYFCGFDSIPARKLLWDKLKKFPIVWMETRIGREHQRFYIVDLRKQDDNWLQEYEATLAPDQPMSELSCGEKGCYSSNSELVGKVVRQMVNIAEGKPFTNLYIGAWGQEGIWRD